MAVHYRKVTLFQRDYSKFFETRFLDDLKNFFWEDLYDENLSINYKFDKFFDRVNYTVQEHVPLKKVKKQQLKLRSKPWVTLYIQNLIKHRDKLLRKLRKSHSIVTENVYKKFRKRVVSENRKSKIQYYDTYFQQNKANMKNLWTGIKEIINAKSKSSLKNTSQLIVGGKTYDDPQQMANIFNNFFVDVPNQVCSKIPRTKKITIGLSKTKNY